MLKIKNAQWIWAFFSLVLLSTACNDDEEPIAGNPQMSEFTPVKGGFGTQVLISGESFPIDASKIRVTINGIEIPIIRSNEEQILVEIPKNKEIGSAPITITIDGKPMVSESTFSYLRTRTVTTLAGTGERGYQDGAGNQAKFAFTSDWGESRRGGIDVDNDLNVYVSDAGNQCIRKITPAGVVSTVAGLGPDSSPDWAINWRLDNGGTGTYNAFIRPSDVKVDSHGNMYVTDDYTGALVKFEPDGKAHYLGWGGTANCLAMDEPNNTLYLNNHNVGKIYAIPLDATMANNINLDGMTPIISNVIWSAGMVVDKKNGDLYLVYHDANTILKYPRGSWNSPVNVAGSGQEGYLDGSALAARFYYPWGIDMDDAGNLYIAGNGNAVASTLASDQSIRCIDHTTGAVFTFAGGGTAGSTDGSFTVASYAGNTNPVASISFSAPTGVAVDKNGTVYVLDRGNNRVRKIETE